MARKNRKSSSRKSVERNLKRFEDRIESIQNGTCTDPVFLTSEYLDIAKDGRDICLELLSKMDAPPKTYQCPICGRIKKVKVILDQADVITCSDCGQRAMVCVDVEGSFSCQQG
jgi:DNA-directed RNA polymerase subunit RPC12/RpoP